MGVLMKWIALFLVGCAGTDITEPCSYANPEFVGYLAQCRARVEEQCNGIPDNDCPVVNECDREIDRRCSDVPPAVSAKD